MAETELGAGLVLDMGHCGETTLAALTPRALLFLDLVGNSLLTTRGHHPSGVPDGVAYSSLSISPVGRRRFCVHLERKVLGLGGWIGKNFSHVTLLFTTHSFYSLKYPKFVYGSITDINFSP